MTEKKQMTRRQAQKLRTDELVLATARKVFRDKGFEAATMRGIAAQMRRSTGSIFARYDSKVALYAGAFGHPPLTPEQGLLLADMLRRVHAFLGAFRDEEGVAEISAEISELLPPLPAPPSPASQGLAAP